MQRWLWVDLRTWPWPCSHVVFHTAPDLDSDAPAHHHRQKQGLKKFTCTQMAMYIYTNGHVHLTAQSVQFRHVYIHSRPSLIRTSLAEMSVLISVLISGYLRQSHMSRLLRYIHTHIFISGCPKDLTAHMYYTWSCHDTLYLYTVSRLTVTYLCLIGPLDGECLLEEDCVSLSIAILHALLEVGTQSVQGGTREGDRSVAKETQPGRGHGEIETCHDERQ